MKKYKLIKKYPGSPELGTIAEKAGDIKYTYPDGTIRLIYSRNECLFEKLIENQPEFWEEVVEKDYEILSIISDNFPKNIFHRNKQNFNEYLRDDNSHVIYTLDYIIENLNKHIRIHSVKRLSDGEVFTVGDRIQYYNITGQKSHTHVISDITIYENEILLNHNHGTWKSHGDFNKVQKVKQPLLTTEDGVDIHEGDTFWVVTNDFNVPFISSTVILKSPNHTSGYYKYFSTKEKAEEYILMVKPCLSVKDILKRFNSKWSEVTETTLKELVKSKI